MERKHKLERLTMVLKGTVLRRTEADVGGGVSAVVRWDGSVGRPEIRTFVGAPHGKRAKKGMFITTGSFSSDAAAYVEHIDPKVVLLDGRRLAELIIDFEVGVTTARIYSVKRVDSDYFEEACAVEHHVRPDRQALAPAVANPTLVSRYRPPLPLLPALTI
jgi:hypothetical protein